MAYPATIIALVAAVMAWPSYWILKSDDCSFTLIWHRAFQQTLFNVER
jgi:hypothetical protein